MLRDQKKQVVKNNELIYSEFNSLIFIHYHGLKAKLDRMFIITPRFDLMTSHPNLVGWEGVGRVGWVAIN